MTSASSATVRELVLDYVREQLEAIGITPEDLPERFDLLAEGVVDSFGFLDLIGRLEERLGLELEFDDIDADELTVFGPFCAHVETQIAAIGAAPRDRSSDQIESMMTISPSRPPREVRPPTLTELRAMGPIRRNLGRSSSGIYRQGVRLRDKAFSLLASGSFASFGPRTVLQLPIRLSGERRIAIGSDGFVGANSWLQVLGSEGGGIAISIGDGVSIAGLCVLSAVESIKIGKNVSFARNVYIADHSHAYDDPQRPILEQGTTASEHVEIGDGAWLGENVLVPAGRADWERSRDQRQFCRQPGCARPLRRGGVTCSSRTALWEIELPG